MNALLAGGALLLLGWALSCLGWYWLVEGRWRRCVGAQLLMVVAVLLGLRLCFSL
jgi:hypothetical protein